MKIDNKVLKKGQKYRVVYDFTLSSYSANSGDIIEILNSGKWSCHIRGTAYYIDSSNRKRIDQQYEDVLLRYDFLDFVEKL